MRLKILLCLVTLIFLMGLSSAAFAEEESPPGFGVYYGEVKAADGSLVASGQVQAYMNGQAVPNAVADIKDGTFEAITVEANMSQENQPLEFRVSFNGKEYAAATDIEVKWNFLDYEKLTLSIDAETGGSPGASEPDRVQLSVSPSEVSMKKGETKQLTLTLNQSDASVTYSSGSTGVATVSPSGLVTAVGNGTAVITVAAAKSGLSDGTAEVQVTVTDMSTNKVQVSVSPSTVTLKPGDTRQLTVSTTPSEATLTYSSNNTGVAAVDSAGLVTAAGIGEALISVNAAKLGFDPETIDIPVSVTDSVYGGGGANSSPRFKDVPSGYWAAGIINSLIQKGIVGGYPDGNFKPENNISRAEFTVILSKAIGKAAENGGSQVYSDVASSQWYYGFVQAASSANLVKGDGTGQFNPDKQITRQEMAVILVRALGLEGTAAAKANEGTAFADDRNIAPWARGFVGTSLMEKIVSGYPDNTFGPENNATRAEACAMIAKLLEKK